MDEAPKYANMKAAGLQSDGGEDATHLGEDQQATALVQVSRGTGSHHAPQPNPWKHIAGLAGNLLMRASGYRK